MHYKPPGEVNEMKNSDSDEQDIARLLKAVGAREGLPEKLMQSWEARFREEIQPVIKRRKQKYRFALGICATVLVAVVTVVFNQPGAVPKPVAIAVVSVAGDSEIRLDNEATEAATIGRTLGPDNLISTARNAYVAISYGSYDLRLNSATTVKIRRDGVELIAGEVYISNEHQGPQGQTLTVSTAFGDISDIGTQFTVRLEENQLISAVRRGAIVINTASGEYRAVATAATARQIILSETFAVEVKSIDHSGEAWDWIYHSAPPFQLEGSSAFDFLRWSTRETGLALEFVSSSAENYARTTILHGDITALNPSQAVRPVLETTHLRAAHHTAGKLVVALLPRN